MCSTGKALHVCSRVRWFHSSSTDNSSAAKMHGRDCRQLSLCRSPKSMPAFNRLLRNCRWHVLSLCLSVQQIVAEALPAAAQGARRMLQLLTRLLPPAAVQREPFPPAGPPTAGMSGHQRCVCYSCTVSVLLVRPLTRLLLRDLCQRHAAFCLLCMFSILTAICQRARCILCTSCVEWLGPAADV